MVITMAASVTEIAGHSLSFYGVDQTTPEGTVATNTGSISAATVAVTTVADDMVLGAGVSGGAASFAPVSPQTERTEKDTPDSASGTARATGTTTGMDWTITSTSAWALAGVAIKPTAVNGTAASPIVVTKSVTTPPQGLYRVLARVRAVGGINVKIGIGYTYGGLTTDPADAGDYGDIATTQTAWHILDIGSLKIPPSTLPDGATVGTLTLRLAMYAASIGAVLDVDWVMLLPVDQGTAYATKAAGTDVVVVDSISNLPVLTLWNTSDVFQSRPEQRGGMIMVDPDGTRIYFCDDDGADAGADEGWKIAVKCIPQYLHIG